jgi:hypothetical protein
VTFSFGKWYDEKGPHPNGVHEHRDGVPIGHFDRLQVRLRSHDRGRSLNNINAPAQVAVSFFISMFLGAIADIIRIPEVSSRIEIWKRRFSQRDVSQHHEISICIIDPHLQWTDCEHLFPSNGDRNDPIRE